VAVAEGSEMPSTLSVHVVRNSDEAAAAGCRWLLAPGYEVIASSDINDDLPTCSFELPPSDDNRPIFIVPSAAKGEEGPFTVVVEGTAPVDVVEVDDHQRELWNYEVDQELEWSDKMPHRKNLGGGRMKKMAPPLTWYRNPQYRVRLKSRAQTQKEQNAAQAAASGLGSALVAEFPFAEAAPDAGGAAAPAGDAQGGPSPRPGTEVSAVGSAEKGEAESSVVSTLESSRHENVHVRVDVLGASNFTDADWVSYMDIFCTCEIKGRDRELFRTKAVTGSDTPTWNHTHVCKDFDTGEMFIFRCFRVQLSGEEEQIGEVALPFTQFSEGFEGAVGMLSLLDEANRTEGGAVRQGFYGQLHLKVYPIEVAGSEVPPGSAASWPPGSAKSDAPPSRGGFPLASPKEEMSPPQSASPKEEQSQSPPLSATTAPAAAPAAAPALPVGGGSLLRPPSADKAQDKPLSAPSNPKAALLQVRMLPSDSNQKVPCAVHIVQNHDFEDKRFPAHEDDGRVLENPFHHTVIGSSCVEKIEYQVASEVGCVCKLVHGATEDLEGENVIVVPSLETAKMHGKFKLELLATEDIIVERVN